MSAPAEERVQQRLDTPVEETHLVCANEEKAPPGVPVLGYCGTVTKGKGTPAERQAVDCRTCEALSPEHPLDSSKVICLGETFGDEACLTCPQHLMRLFR